jgi:putative intracellular protease/amidase
MPLAGVKVEAFGVVFYPGGHGPLWHLAEDADSIRLIETMHKAGKPLVIGRKGTGFTNSEEEAEQLTGVMPFLLEDVLTQSGGNFSSGPDWQSYVVSDGNLVTGQNPASPKKPRVNCWRV